jgi:hypothetical protein
MVEIQIPNAEHSYGVARGRQGDECQGIDPPNDAP